MNNININNHALQTTTQNTGSNKSITSKLSKEFITLLSAQMRNQDPSEPMKSHELTAQLAQIASLEQQEGTNKIMQSLSGTVGKLGNFSALNAVGKEVTVDLNVFSYEGKGVVSGNIMTKGRSSSEPVIVEVRNKAGDVIKSLTFKSESGEIKWSWDGTDGNGNKVGEDVYQISAYQEVNDGDKTKRFNLPTISTSKIKGLNFLNGMFSMENGVNLPMKDIVSLTEPKG